MPFHPTPVFSVHRLGQLRWWQLRFQLFINQQVIIFYLKSSGIINILIFENIQPYGRHYPRRCDKCPKLNRESC